MDTSLEDAGIAGYRNIIAGYDILLEGCVEDYPVVHKRG